MISAFIEDSHRQATDRRHIERDELRSSSDYAKP
jgi:hypothetical protein